MESILKVILATDIGSSVGNNGVSYFWDVVHNGQKYKIEMIRRDLVKDYTGDLGLESDTIGGDLWILRNADEQKKRGRKPKQ